MPEQPKADPLFAPLRDSATLGSIAATAERLASFLQLPFRKEVWKGSGGNWLGAGVGSSIDFQDHRPYIPGDDPRYINWQAYARTDNYTMKLYREEVSPSIDFVMDCTGSMFLTEEKTTRTLELFYFTMFSALRTMASLRIYLINGRELRSLTTQAVRAHNWWDVSLEISEDGKAPDFTRIPWRPRAMRIVLSDLLFPGEARDVFRTFIGGHHGGILFIPWAKEEANPDWLGNVELIDCEAGARKPAFFTEDQIQRYLQSYRAHFENHSSFCRARHIRFVRVPAHEPLETFLVSPTATDGAIEPIKG